MTNPSDTPREPRDDSPELIPGDWAQHPPSDPHPAARLVAALKGRRIVDASCDAEGSDDVRLLLDDDTVVAIDSDIDLSEESQRASQMIGRPVPFSRLVVEVGPRAQLWPIDAPH